jgi:hypothetical protein
VEEIINKYLHTIYPISKRKIDKDKRFKRIIINKMDIFNNQNFLINNTMNKSIAYNLIIKDVTDIFPNNKELSDKIIRRYLSF